MSSTPEQCIFGMKLEFYDVAMSGCSVALAQPTRHRRCARHHGGQWLPRGRTRACHPRLDPLACVMRHAVLCTLALRSPQGVLHFRFNSFNSFCLDSNDVVPPHPLIAYDSHPCMNIRPCRQASDLHKHERGYFLFRSQGCRLI